MGRLIGKRPDDTRRIAKRVARYLEPGEQVLAGVHLQKPGTLSAAMESGTSAAVGATMGLPPSFPDDDPKEKRGWDKETGAAGIDAETAKRTHWVYLVLTSSRVLIVRRSRMLQWQARELIASWPLEEIERIEAPRNRGHITVHHVAGSFTFELPQAHKFLPQVYRDLPAIHEETAGKVERHR